MIDQTPKTSSKIFAISFIEGFLLMLVGVTALHVLGNPDQLFASPFMPSHSQRSWKSRRLQTLIDEKKPPQVVVLGSSRMRQVSPKQIEAITGLTTFNYAVGGASCIESLAQAKSLVRRGIIPKILILGVDERALLGMYEDHVGHATEDHYLFRELSTQEKLHHASAAFTEISFPRTLAAIANLIHGPPKVLYEKPEKVENFVCDDGYMVNASHIRARKKAPANPALLEKRIISMTSKKLKYARSQYARQAVDQAQIKAIRDLAKLCKANNIQLKIMTTPLQPGFQKAINSSKMLSRVESAIKRIKQLRGSMNFEFHDFRELPSFNGEPLEFWDPWHVTPVNMRRMTNRLFDQDANAIQPGVPDDVELMNHPPPISSMSVW